MVLCGLQKTGLLDFPGLLSCTVFTGGCNFRCPFCHNAPLVKGTPDRLSEEELFAFLKKRQGLLDGVCVTGGEPCLHEDLPELLGKIRALGYKVKLDTNGSRPEMLKRDFFPWVHDPGVRASLFDPAIAHQEEGLSYLREVCRQSRDDCPVLDGESSEDRTARIATWLSTRYFMTSLLARKDRMSMYSAVEVRVPFADHRILEYVFNVPWRIKYGNGVEKSLLRHAMTDYLPDRVLWRKKSPYPKTHHPDYERLVHAMLLQRLENSDGFLANALERSKLNALLQGENTTWFGQLMARPQLLAWLCQLEDWFYEYHVVLTD